ncbi:IQ-DOMAIN 32-like protein [Tanacetum coccineum]|uniref:IQ-DOMAIN 32-like protein n=1 Tax=Tanacetum coccineum TaxID=301880 RepID=A0ABQ5I6E3_9ASTR
MSESLNVVNPRNGNIPDLIITVTYCFSILIITKLYDTKKFFDKIGELRAVSGHMLGASEVQIPQNNLDSLQSIREEDGTLGIVDSLLLLSFESGSRYNTECPCNPIYRQGYWRQSLAYFLYSGDTHPCVPSAGTIYSLESMGLDVIEPWQKWMLPNTTKVAGMKILYYGITYGHCIACWT